jgi:F-type H+-transporting ATPase subunit alpha
MSTVTKEFDKLVASGNPVGEVISVDKFLIKVRGLQPVSVHTLVMFEDGSQGYVYHVYEDYMIVMNLSPDPVRVGMVAVVRAPQLVASVGKGYIGRVVSVMGDPLDGKGPIVPDGTWPIFHTAPMLYERELLDKQLETGLIVLDTLFSLVRGQRMAVLGDGKSGKSTLATQIAIHQKSTDITTVYVLIAKRYSDITTLVDRLKANGVMEKSIVIVSTMSDSLVVSHLAPYVACAMGEYLWQQCDMDTLIVYDDLTTHAQVHREISLLAGVSPGRDSYPGDTFYAHSQLVERAGKLARNHKTQTILPLVYAPAGDITAYMPTNIMSMTDGQWILDMNVFRESMRPAVSTGLSVTRVGGVGQSQQQKVLAGQTFKAIAAYRQASEFARFGADLSDKTQHELETGYLLFRLMTQSANESYRVIEQELMLDVVLSRNIGAFIDVGKLKAAVVEGARIAEAEPEGAGYDKAKEYLVAASSSSQPLPVANTGETVEQPQEPAAQPAQTEQPEQQPPVEAPKG